MVMRPSGAALLFLPALQLLTPLASHADCSQEGQCRGSSGGRLLAQTEAELGLDERLSLLQSYTRVLVRPDGTAAGSAEAQATGQTVASELSACRGDGTAKENIKCKSSPSRSECTRTPGCNWNGGSHFDGWCSGLLDCVHTASPSVCEAIAGCRWVQATEAVHIPAEHEADAAGATLGSSCQGDGTAAENPMCKIIVVASSCSMSPGCNWLGQSSFGGWCKGGPSCNALTVETMCGTLATCEWTHATAAAPATAAAGAAALTATAAAATAGAHSARRA